MMSADLKKNQWCMKWDDVFGLGRDWPLQEKQPSCLVSHPHWGFGEWILNFVNYNRAINKNILSFFVVLFRSSFRGFVLRFYTFSTDRI